MTEYLIGAAVASYLLVLGYFAWDMRPTYWHRARWWEWALVMVWPLAFIIGPIWRYIEKRRKYEYRDDPRWGRGWYTKRSRP